MRFREVKEVTEIKEVSKREKGISLIDKLDVIEGRVSGFQDIKPTDGWSFEENKEYWRQMFQNGFFG